MTEATGQVTRIEFPKRSTGSSDGSRQEIYLPVLHDDQIRAFQMPGRFKVVRCGRRWGKTLLGETIAADAAVRGKFVGWFAPEYKFISEAYTELAQMMAPCITRASRNDGLIRTNSGGRIDFWSLENERAGRSRRYHQVIIDEAAFAKANMKDVWRKAIRPTLVDYRGSCIALSNTNGIDPSNFLWQLCNDPDMGFVEYHAPTSANPYMPREELIQIEAETHPLVYQQEYLAEFVDFGGVAFFPLPSLLDNDRPVEYPPFCDLVFATIDTAMKDRSEHDGTAVIYWARNAHVGTPLIILDYDIIKVEGSLLEVWLPSVYQRMEDLARQCRARFGATGAYIEDKGSGTILLQQARRRGLPAEPIDGQLVALGKDARAVSVSGYVHRGEVKISGPAYDRTMIYNETSRNHLLGQVVGYRVGVDNREDDLFDAFCYGVACALGDAKGF